jgi:hypothetical protein
MTLGEKKRSERRVHYQELLNGKASVGSASFQRKVFDIVANGCELEPKARIASQC